MVRHSQLNQSNFVLSGDYPLWHVTRSISTICGIELPLDYVRLAPKLQSGGNVSPEKMYPYNGQNFTGQSVDFAPSAEPFSQYTLADGTTLRVKTVLINAVRLDTHNDQGDPVYQFQFQQVMAILAPESLKRKAQ